MGKFQRIEFSDPCSNLESVSKNKTNDIKDGEQVCSPSFVLEFKKNESQNDIVCFMKDYFPLHHIENDV